MRGSKPGFLAASVLVAGLAGCSLPEVLPLASGNTSGPSPYGPWYEQHWATNAVLLAAADQSDEDAGLADDAAIDAALAEDAASAEAAQPGGEAAVEASAGTGEQSVEFSNSTPYQFPSSSFAPAPAPAGAAPPSDDVAPPSPAAAEKKAAPAPGGPIRY